jgi:Uncharacterized conserved protein (DUF2190)
VELAEAAGRSRHGRLTVNAPRPWPNGYPKAAGAVAQGTPLYWDNTAKIVTATSDGNTRIGVAVVPAAAGDATVTVRLNGSF